MRVRFVGSGVLGIGRVLGFDLWVFGFKGAVDWVGELRSLIAAFGLMAWPICRDNLGF